MAKSGFVGRTTILFALIGIWTTDPVCSASDVQFRTWTDASGNHSVEADFVAFEGGNVRLLKSDGAPILVPYKVLSAPDQNYVRDRLRQSRILVSRKPTPVAKLRTNRLKSHPADANAQHGINWFPANSVSTIASGEDPKPVMWFRVLGALDGFM